MLFQLALENMHYKHAAKACMQNEYEHTKRNTMFPLGTMASNSSTYPTTMNGEEYDHSNKEG